MGHYMKSSVVFTITAENGIKQFKTFFLKCQICGTLSENNKHNVMPQTDKDGKHENI
jgi:hypothetical protein